MSITLEQFNDFAKNLDDTERKRVARSLGLKLPQEPVSPLSDQLQQVKVASHKSKRNPDAPERQYVMVPHLKITNEESARGFWLNARIARSVAKRIIEICDEKGL
jgi:hypothetical protein